MPSLLSKDYCPKRRAESDPEGEPPIKKLELLHLGSTISQDEPAKKQDELTDSDNMLLDDTRNTNYIYNIERELASIEAQEKQISFLPDIERTLNSIPKSILQDPKPEQRNELVLYHVPRSLTVSEDRDNVRKAIIESRARVRGRQTERSAPEISIASFSDKKDNTTFTFEAGDIMDVDSQR